MESHNNQCQDGFGNQVRVKHSDRTIGLYAHLQRVDIDVGQA